MTMYLIQLNGIVFRESFEGEKSFATSHFFLHLAAQKGMTQQKARGRVLMSFDEGKQDGSGRHGRRQEVTGGR